MNHDDAEKIIDDVLEHSTERFLLHYNFPPFSTVISITICVLIGLTGLDITSILGKPTDITLP